LHEECETIFTQKEKEGINSVHNIDVEPTRIDHSFFANLITGRKTFYLDSSWPSVDLLKDPIFKYWNATIMMANRSFPPSRRTLLLLMASMS
jgi:hypothetical protein